VTRELVDKLVEADLREFRERHMKNTLTSAEIPNEILEHKIMQIKLNGYETPMPFGKVAQDISVSVFISMIPRSVKHDLINLIAKNFHNDKVALHSFSFAVFDSVRGMDFDRNGFVFVDAERELTEVIAVKNGIIEESVSFPFGRNFLLRALGDEFKTIHDEALTLMGMYQARTVTPEVMARITSVIGRVKKEWTEMLYESLKKISSHHLLPEHFFVVAGKDCWGIFFDFMKEVEMKNMLILNRPPVVKCMGEELFQDFCKNKSACPDDIYFMSEAIFANKIYGE